MDVLHGEVVGWKSDPKADTGWHIIHVLDLDGIKHTVTGCSMPRPGAQVELHGAWESSAKWGDQFHCRVVAKARPPLTADGVKRWLRERVPGVGASRAESLLVHFGHDAAKLWAAVESGPEALAGIEGISPEVARAAHEAMQAEGAASEYQALLFGWGMTQRQIAKVKAHWPLEEATRLLHANPYLLADHVSGFGFRRADAVAVKLGIAPTSPVRLNAAVLHYLEAALGEGHVFADEAVMKAIARESRISFERLIEAVRALSAAKRLVVEDGARIYLPELYAAECNVARDLLERFRVFPQRDVLTLGASNDAFAVGDAVIVEADESNVDPWQQQAIERLADLTLPIVFITGGPGTGKTTVLKQALQRLDCQPVQVFLAAPTGKAAKRMTEATGRKAYTLHSLLGYRPARDIDCDVCKDAESSFDYSRLSAHEGEYGRRVVVVDEASMVDIRLWAALAELGGDTTLRFVGDAHQLPPVGGGQPFGDALSVAPPDAVVRLRTVYRSKGEWVKAAAPQMLAGQVPPLDAAPGLRCIPVAAADQIVHAVCDCYAGKYDDENFRVAAALQDGHMPVLIPQRTGSAGVNAVNFALHNVFNPRTLEDEAAVPLEDGTELRVGSWVMITKNDHKKGVCNGDTAYITRVEANGSVALNVDSDDGGERVYTKGEAREQLRLAYASTVHKAQGSEYAWIVCVCHSIHKRMLTRRLLYTAITRAKEGVVLIGDREGVEWAIGNAREVSRCTWLTKRVGFAHAAQ